MLFNSLEFLGFFLVVYLLYVTTSHRVQNWVLLAASIIFYGAWDWRFLFLLALPTVIDFACAIGMERQPQRKKGYLLVSLITNLSLLAFFKYFGFFTENLNALLSALGFGPSIPILKIVLPVGISFYTFQTLSYTIDVYRGHLAAVRNFADFALYISFFPQLVAGPIERATSLLPQVVRPRTVTPEDRRAALWLIGYGYLLKTFMADNLAAIANQTYDKVGVIDGAEALVGTYAFAFQIFGDFAGYSSIAIGIARLLGFQLMTNFLYPYFVTNPQDFWKHWHISLSTWLRDYLYIPLGGNRGGPARNYRNLFLTMLLGGIWHGAAWTFVIWGAFHGVILIVHRLVASVVKPMFQPGTPAAVASYLIRVVIMFHVTCVGWLIFRAQSWQQVVDMFRSVATNFSGISGLALTNLKLLAFYAGPILAIQLYQWRRDDLLAWARLSDTRRALCYAAIFLCIMIWGEFGANEFIYFQF